MSLGLTVFLDRDGVINKKMPDGKYVISVDEFVFLPGAKEGLRLLREKGIRTIIVTNQRGIARGLVTVENLNLIHEYMERKIIEAGGKLDGIYCCPHEKDTCTCRKPSVGLFMQAATDFPDIDFRNSILIGDSITDMEAGAKIGCRNILICGERKRDEVLRQAIARGIPLHAVESSLLDATRKHILRSA